MPLGLRVVRKVEAIVREEMNRAGAIELFMPAVQPRSYGRSRAVAEVRTGLLASKTVRTRFLRRPNHEEVITTLRGARSQLPQLPCISTRSRPSSRRDPAALRRHARREFIMKDGYSFTRLRRLQREYRNMYDTYTGSSSAWG